MSSEPSTRFGTPTEPFSVSRLGYSGLTRRALRFAEQAHRGTVRKGGVDVPYVTHCFAAGQVLAMAGCDDNLIAAGYLHDVKEDVEGYTLAGIADEFGSDIAELVGAVSKESFASDGRRYSAAEKAESTEELMCDAPIRVCALKAGDLTVNIADLIFDARVEGFDAWITVFKTVEKADLKLDHYLDLAEILIARLEAENVYPLLAQMLRERAGTLDQMVNAWRAARA